MYLYINEWEKVYKVKNIISVCHLFYQDFFFFLINAFTCNMLSICIPHVGISKIKEICMSILLINGIIVFGNDKRDDD